MKMKTKIISIVIFTLLFTACSPQETVTTETITTNNNGGGDGNTGGTDNGGGTGTGNNGGGTQTNSCAGTTSDGYGDGYPIHHFNLFLAGHQTWVPGTYSDPLLSDVPTINEASIIFKSDSRVKVRLKIHSQPHPTAGETYCYGRTTGAAGDPYTYTKLRMRVSLRDVLCQNPDPQNSNNCLSGFYLGNSYGYQYLSPVAVNSCSNVIDIGAIRNQTTYGTVVQVDDVKADSTCQSNNTQCPAEQIVRRASCWHMTMQIVTDYTQDFKN